MAVELTQSGIEVTGIESNSKCRTCCPNTRESRNGTASLTTGPLFEKMAKIVGGYRSMNVEGVVEESFNLDSEQQLTSRSAQHTRSSWQQNLATANLQEETAREKQKALLQCAKQAIFGKMLA
ncbi:uncharacterized protein LOC105664646 [Ceratitis capitata]|uniref:(Mediterranean fruit fly) hypothetical protein n=1 Tax=Ceratitis capitata TaxID=7213 RepID=A0A811UR52_CERCA|nr:uncharacterized protein LOC105664646 [Ceratitis capitata]CAD7001652.1 unnamed protein product [Ceratitis capitata]